LGEGLGVRAGLGEGLRMRAIASPTDGGATVKPT